MTVDFVFYLASMIVNLTEKMRETEDSTLEQKAVDQLWKIVSGMEKANVDQEVQDPLD